MPRPNRVLPTGEIVALPFRGTMFGNRGVLHDEDARLRRPWQVRRWICCVLRFKGRRRTIMAPGRYTELFFLDEAVALAAGHRPCAECRRCAFNAYRAAWARAHACAMPSADEMDSTLHVARIDPRSRDQRRFPARLGDLPDGVFVQVPGSPPALLWQGSLHPYPGLFYGPAEPAPAALDVEVLTPVPSVAALREGYRPEVALP